MVRNLVFLVVTVLAAAGRAPSVIHLDLGPELLPSVGFEFGLDHGAQLEGRLAEGAWLTEWVRRGWCRPELVAGLCRWPEVTVHGYALHPDREGDGGDVRIEGFACHLDLVDAARRDALRAAFRAFSKADTFIDEPDFLYAWWD